MQHIHSWEYIDRCKVHIWIGFWYVKYYTEKFTIHAFIYLYVFLSIKVGVGKKSVLFH